MTPEKISDMRAVRGDAAETRPSHPNKLMTVPQTLARVVRAYPDFEALVDDDIRLSYAELDDLMRRTASALSEAGCSAGDIVALLTRPTSAHVVSWLAVVHLGAIPLALHVRESSDQLAQIVDKFKATYLIADEAIEHIADGISASSSGKLTRLRLTSTLNTPSLGEDGGIRNLVPADCPRQELFPGPREDDVATIILSSGTTSLPKGIAHTHRSLVEACRSSSALYGSIGPTSRFAVPLSTAFTGCYVSWLPALHAGGCSVFLPKFDLERFPQRISDEAITHVALTPTMWRKLLTLTSDPQAYRTVEAAVFAAEPMDGTTLEKMKQVVTPHVAHAYGSTETLGFVTVLTAQDMKDDRTLSVGRPFPTTEIRLLDENENPVAPGAVGSIWVSSPLLGAGIWEAPEIDAKVFCERDGIRWWHSGDLAMRDDDGFYYLMGRQDDMIISGGINIMPKTVEEVLLSHPKITEAAVVGINHPLWGEQPHAFLVCSDAFCDSAEVDAFVLASSLSDYQRPRGYRFVESLPYTSSNKVDRKTLRARYAAMVANGTE